MTKVQIICHDSLNDRTSGLDELNQLLASGWSIARTEQLSVAAGSAGGSSGARNGAHFALAFILQKDAS